MFLMVPVLMSPSSERRVATRLRLLAVTVSCLVGSASPLTAQDTSATRVDTVQVRARAERRYAPSTTSSATRLPTAVRETPLTVQVIDRSLLTDRNVQTPRELANLVAGVQQIVGYGNVASQWFIMRGFSTGGVNYRDGYRSSDTYTPRDFANVERVEFVKGPASVLYGQAQPAGAVNTITKTPLPVSLLTADVQMASFRGLRSTVDANVARGSLSARLNAAVEDANSYVDFEGTQNLFLAPGVRFKPTERLDLLYTGEYQRTTVDGFSNGLPMATGVFGLNASATVSQPWARLRNENVTHRLEARLRLNDAWQLRQGVYHALSNRTYAGVSPAFNQFDGTALANYPIMYNGGPEDDQRNTVWQTEVNGLVTTGPLTHRLLVGYERFESRFNFAFYDQFGCDNVGNCFADYTSRFSAPLPSPTGGFTGAFNDSTSARTNAGYVADQVAWGNWRLQLGLRHDRARTISGTSLGEADATTGRIGLLRLVGTTSSVYANLGQSFVPNTGIAEGGGVLDPERGSQMEVGIKHTFARGVDVSVSAFQIDKSNVRFPSATQPTRFRTIGEQQSRGAEFTMAGQLTAHTRIVGNYAYLDFAKVTRSANPADEGKSLYGVARHNANVWLLREWTLAGASSFAVGGGIVTVGDRPADNNGSGFTLPSYTRFDVGAFYRRGRLDVSLHAKNVNDASIFDTVDGFFVQRQAPRNFALRVAVTR